jgi:hypothetical protein
VYEGLQVEGLVAYHLLLVMMLGGTGLHGGAAGLVFISQQ